MNKIYICNILIITIILLIIIVVTNYYLSIKKEEQFKAQFKIDYDDRFEIYRFDGCYNINTSNLSKTVLPADKQLIDKSAKFAKDNGHIYFGITRGGEVLSGPVKESVVTNKINCDSMPETGVLLYMWERDYNNKPDIKINTSISINDGINSMSGPNISIPTISKPTINIMNKQETLQETYPDLNTYQETYPNLNNLQETYPDLNTYQEIYQETYPDLNSLQETINNNLPIVSAEEDVYGVVSPIINDLPPTNLINPIVDSVLAEQLSNPIDTTDISNIIEQPYIEESGVTKQWSKVPSGNIIFSYIDASSSSLYGVGINKDNNEPGIYKCNRPCNGGWEKENIQDSNNVKMLNIQDPSNIYYINNNNIRQWDINNNKSVLIGSNLPTSSKIKDIAATKNGVVVIDDNNIMYNGTRQNNNLVLSKSSIGEYMEVTADDDNLYALDKNGNVLLQGSNNTEWKNIGTNMKYISAGDTYLWGVDGNNHVMSCIKPCDTGLWTPMIHNLDNINQVTGSNNDVYGVDGSGNIWQTNYDNIGINSVSPIVSGENLAEVYPQEEQQEQRIRRRYPQEEQQEQKIRRRYPQEEQQEQRIRRRPVFSQEDQQQEEQLRKKRQQLLSQEEQQRRRLSQEEQQLKKRQQQLLSQEEQQLKKRQQQLLSQEEQQMKKHQQLLVQQEQKHKQLIAQETNERKKQQQLLVQEENQRKKQQQLLVQQEANERKKQQQLLVQEENQRKKQQQLLIQEENQRKKQQQLLIQEENQRKKQQQELLIQEENQRKKQQQLVKQEQQAIQTAKNIAAAAAEKERRKSMPRAIRKTYEQVGVKTDAPVRQIQGLNLPPKK
jgi:hypothetical protein